MAQDNTLAEADGYYDEDTLGDDELDLSFLDKEDQNTKK